MRKKYVAKYEQILFYETFFCYELETDVNNVMKKKNKKKTVSLKSCYSRQLLFSLALNLSHTARFLLDLKKQYYSLFMTNLSTC